MPSKPISNRKSFGLSPYVVVVGIAILIGSLAAAWWLPDISGGLFYLGAAIALAGMVGLVVGAFRYSRRLSQIEHRRENRHSGDSSGDVAKTEPDPNAEIHAAQTASAGPDGSTRSPQHPTSTHRLAHAGV